MSWEDVRVILRWLGEVNFKDRKLKIASDQKFSDGIQLCAYFDVYISGPFNRLATIPVLFLWLYSLITRYQVFVHIRIRDFSPFNENVSFIENRNPSGII